MNYKKFYIKIQAKYLINILFLIGFVIAGIRLENYLYETEDYCNNPVLENNELVLPEQPKEEYILTDYNDRHEDISYDIVDTRNISSYKFTIISYNSFILNKFKTIITNHIYHSDIISILQKNNIWHKSFGEEPSFLR